jgi:hypothetical protein
MSVGLSVFAIVLGAVLSGAISMGVERPTVSAGEPAPGTVQEAVPGEPFRLTAVEGRLSLQAENAPLKAIVEEMGRQLAIEVMARIPPDEWVTLAFDGLTLPEALARLRPYVHSAVVEDAVKGPGRVRRLVVVSKRLAGPPSRPTTGDTVESMRPTAQAPARLSSPRTPSERPQPFRFEFDPAAGQEPRR